MSKIAEELSNEELLYAAKYNFPLFANQYSKIERAALKEKAFKFAARKKSICEERKHKILFS